MARPRIIGLLLALITLVVYLPAGRHDYLVFDDPDYVTENRIVRQGINAQGVVWAFSSFHASNWHPVTWLSHMLDCELFGVNAGAHHIINALWHAANTVLLFALLLQLTGKLWPAAILAALFAWHPLRVESVAWIAERKDVLSLFFGLLCLLAYTKYAKQSSVQPLKLEARPAISASYCWAVLFLAVGLMAKPMLVTVPFLLLLLDWWPLQRIKATNIRASLQRLVLEKTPFFVLVVASCVLTVLAQRSEAMVALENVTLELRLKNALIAFGGYLLKTIWPANLAIIYPFPKEIPLSNVVIAGIVVAGITVMTWRYRSTKPHLLLGWLWFIGSLVPVIGIVQVGGQAMADRYSYLPQIGLLIAVSIEAASWTGGNPTRTKCAAALAGAAALACLALTTRQLSYWRDSETLFNRTLAVTRNNPIAHINLGVALEQQGRIAEARKQYEAAAQIDPNRVQAQVNLANVLDLSGETEAALEHYRMALQLKRDAPLVHVNFGSALVNLGRFDEAKLHYEEAQRLAPNDPRPAYLLGKSLLRQGRSQDAVSQFKAALRLDQNHLQSIVWLARVRAADNDPWARDGVEAVSLAERAASLTDTSDPFVLDTLAAAYAEAGNFNEAQQILQRAIQLHSAAGDTNTAALAKRQQLYQLRLPYRESFTNTGEANPVIR